MNNSEETTERMPERNEILKAIADLSNKIDKMERNNNAQFEAIREGIVYNSARFDHLEAIALDAKSIALSVRGQLTILTEEIHQMKKETVM